MSGRFRDTKDGECIGAATQRNPRQDWMKIVKTTKCSSKSGKTIRPRRTSACLVVRAINLTNPRLGEAEYREYDQVGMTTRCRKGLLMLNLPSFDLLLQFKNVPLAPENCWPTLVFGLHGCIIFWAHAVRARGSDGHQNVLSLVSYSHILENRWKQKARCLPNKNKTNPTKNKTKTPQKDTRRTRWDTTLSEKKSSGRSVLLHDGIAIPANRCPKWLQLARSHSRWWSCIITAIGEVGSPHVHIDEAAQGRSFMTYVVAIIQAPEKCMEGCCFLLLRPRWLKRILEEPHFIPLWPGNRPWRRWKTSPSAVLPAQPGIVSSPTMDKCPLRAHCSDLCFVVTDTTVKEPGVRDWRQCEQWRECPKDSVVRGLIRKSTGHTGFFFDQCCARHNNCGSHVTVLK